MSKHSKTDLVNVTSTTMHIYNLPINTSVGNAQMCTALCDEFELCIESFYK